jgi:hypothetical protein
METNIDNLNQFHNAINSAEVLKSQQMMKAVPSKIEDKFSYDVSAEAIKVANDAIKHIETHRKTITLPLDAYKKQLMDIEKAATQPLRDFIEQRKGLMVEYSNELERIKAEADAKIAAEAKKAMLNSGAGAVADIMAHFTDAMTATTLDNDHTKNIRISKKAEIVGDVDWSTLLMTIMQAELFDVSELLRKLPKAMELTNTTAIKGIKIVEVKTQVIR